MSLTFDAASHTYYWCGVRVPSVTQVLEDVGIIDYSHIPEPIRRHALDRGSAVHLASRYSDEGDLAENTISDEIRPYLQAWRSFRTTTGFEPGHIERQYYQQRYRYAGTLDRVGYYTTPGFRRRQMPAESPILLDIKTGEAPDWVRYQLAAYANFYQDPGQFRRVAVELRKDGTYQLYEFDCADLIRDFSVFVSALTVYRAKRREI